MCACSKQIKELTMRMRLPEREEKGRELSLTDVGEAAGAEPKPAASAQADASEWLSSANRSANGIVRLLLLFFLLTRYRIRLMLQLCALGRWPQQPARNELSWGRTGRRLAQWLCLLSRGRRCQQRGVMRGGLRRRRGRRLGQRIQRAPRAQ